MYQYAVIRADLNSSASEIISRHKSEAAAERSASRFDGTTGEIGLYIAHLKQNGEYESRLEARDRRERM